MLLGTAPAILPTAPRRCDLLSFHYLCAIRNSRYTLVILFIRVVICFHFIIFVLLGTAVVIRYPHRPGCDLLSFHYLCAIRNSSTYPDSLEQAVVICFHFIIFVLLGTARFASRLVFGCCDLLSFHYLCAIRNSRRWGKPTAAQL